MFRQSDRTMTFPIHSFLFHVNFLFQQHFKDLKKVTCLYMAMADGLLRACTAHAFVMRVLKLLNEIVCWTVLPLMLTLFGLSRWCRVHTVHYNLIFIRNIDSIKLFSSHRVGQQEKRNNARRHQPLQLTQNCRHTRE